MGCPQSKLKRRHGEENVAKTENDEVRPNSKVSCFVFNDFNRYFSIINDI